MRVPLSRRLAGWGLLLLLAGCRPEKADGPKPPPPLRVAMDPRIGEPFVYQPTPETFGGFEVDICRYLAGKLHRPLEIVSTPWNQLPESLRKQRADLALNAIEQPAAGQMPEQLIATKQYYTAYQQLAVAKKDKYTYNLSDLKGQKVGVVEGSVAKLLLEELNKLKKAHIKVVPFASPQAAFKALGAGQVRAILAERALAGWYSFKSGKLRLTGEPITRPTPYVGLLRAEDAGLKKSLDGLLTQALKDPAFKKIFDKWHVSIRR